MSKTNSTYLLGCQPCQRAARFREVIIHDAVAQPYHVAARIGGEQHTIIALEHKRCMSSAVTWCMDSSQPTSNWQYIAIADLVRDTGGTTSTVYAIFKNKRGILRAIRETWHQESGQRDIYQSALTQPVVERRLELAAHATRRQWETGSRMIAIYRGAAAVDPEAAAELKEALQGRRAHLDRFIEASGQTFRLDLTLAQAAAIFRALTLAEIYAELIEQGEWTPDEYEQWLAQALKQQLLG